MLILENTFQTRMSVSISVSVSLRWSVFRPHSILHTPATRRKHALSFSLSLGLELWVKGGRNVELAFNSMWVESKRLKRFGIVDHFEKLQLMSSRMSFSDFDCTDNNFVMEGEGEDSLASKRRVEANSGFR